VLGSYLEVIVGIPHTVAMAGSHRRYMFIVEMHTDSAVAIWGDRSLRYGYRKAMRRFQARRFESYRVSTMDGSAILSATLAPPAHDAWVRPTDAEEFQTVRDALNQPLLGHLGGDRFALSRLEHGYDGEGAVVAPVAGRLRLSGGLPSQLRGALDVERVSGRGPWGGFCSRAIDTRVTYPEHRALTTL
jgi:hypothetical protein